MFLKQNIFSLERSRPATIRRGDVVTTSLCTSQWRPRYVLNETPNEVSLERRLDVSVVRIHDIPFYVSTTSPVSPKRNTQMTLLWYVSTPPRVFDTCYVVAPVSTFSSYFVMNSIWYISTPHLNIKSNMKETMRVVRIKNEQNDTELHVQS